MGRVMTLPAAAVPEGTAVIMPKEANESDPIEIHVVKVENSTPRPGLITWWSEEDMPYVIGGNVDVIIVSLPDAIIDSWNRDGASK